MWEHPDIAGITLWGYIKDDIWREDAYLVLGPSTTLKKDLLCNGLKIMLIQQIVDAIMLVLCYQSRLKIIWLLAFIQTLLIGSSIDLMLEKDIISINIISPRGKLLYQKNIDQFTRSIKISLMKVYT